VVPVEIKQIRNLLKSEEVTISSFVIEGDDEDIEPEINQDTGEYAEVELPPKKAK
jgi:hypothetical protein